MAAEARGRETRPRKRAWTKPHRRHRAAIGIEHVGLVLGVVALALGGSGLAIALTNSGHAGAAGAPGATGPTGAPGPRGAPGPGAVTYSVFDGEYVLIPDDACTAYDGSTLSFVVSGPGVVVLTAAVELGITHTYDYSTDYYVGIENASQECSTYDSIYGYVGDFAPSDYYYPDVSLAAEYTIGAAGTYTYDIDAVAYNNSASDATAFSAASVVGTFYPS